MDKKSIEALVKYVHHVTLAKELFDEYGEKWMKIYAPERPIPRKEPWCHCLPGCPGFPMLCPGCNKGLCT